MPSTARRAMAPEGNAVPRVMATRRAGALSEGGQSWPQEYGSGTRLSAVARPTWAGSADRMVREMGLDRPVGGCSGAKTKSPARRGEAL